jgi:hypothetical protein
MHNATQAANETGDAACFTEWEVRDLLAAPTMEEMKSQVRL